MASPQPSGPLKWHPAKDPIVWTFIGLLAFTLFFAMFGAYQNNRIAGLVRSMEQYNHDQLDFLRKAFEERQAELKAERDRLRAQP